MSRIILPNAGIQRGTMAPHLLRRAGDDSIDSLDELGDWFAYGLPGGVTGNGGATGWLDASPNGRDLDAVSETPARSTFSSGRSYLTVSSDGALGINLSVGDTAIMSAFHSGTMFTAVRESAVGDNNYAFSVNSDFSSRWSGVKTIDTAGDVQYALAVDRVNSQVGENVYEIDAVSAPSVWHIIWAVIHDLAPADPTVELYVSSGPEGATGLPQAISKTIIGGTTDGMWHDSIDQDMASMSVGAKFRVPGASSHKFTGDIGAWGIMGTASGDLAGALSQADINRADVFVRSLLS